MNRESIRHFSICTKDARPVTPYVFGHNLEHTRACVAGGLSAQMLRNRKFAGRPSARRGVAAEWFGVGDRAFFCTDQEHYVRHFKDNGMWRRNETNGQTVQNTAEGETAGIGQEKLHLLKDQAYSIAFVARCRADTEVCIAFTDRDRKKVYASFSLSVPGGDWQRMECMLTSPVEDAQGVLMLTFTKKVSLTFGAVSMLPQGHFHGMRSDVVKRLKEMGVSLLRWPGGNFAGEYRWQDMFLPVDMRAPLQAYTEDETQPYTHGYDMHEIDTDSFIALCREIGAEPYITLNPQWDTAEECAAWVEYCNGDESTPYGRLRAQRGHKEPYHVKLWSLGNEFGYGHMEGPMSPEGYYEHCMPVAKAILAVSPDLSICTAGPYNYEDRMQEWIEKSARQFAPVAPCVSFHTYQNLAFDFASDEGIRRVYHEALKAAEGNRQVLYRLRENLPWDIRISWDEWNVWAAWFRKSCTIEGMHTAVMLHTLLTECDKMGVSYACYFQPIGEGAIDVYPDRAELSANGQVFALLKAHKGGKLCSVLCADEKEALATEKNGVVTVSVINAHFDSAQEYLLDGCGKVLRAKCLVAGDLLPGSRFTEEDACMQAGDGMVSLTLPPRSLCLVQMEKE